jgi:hypothetical protein
MPPFVETIFPVMAILTVSIILQLMERGSALVRRNVLSKTAARRTLIVVLVQFVLLGRAVR